MLHGIYVGARQDLKGKGAVVLEADNNGGFRVQFDDVSTGLGYGYHDFDRSDFVIEENLMLHGIYVGARQELKGKGAILMRAGDERYVAQFDDTDMEYSAGWHPFGITDFELDAED